MRYAVSLSVISLLYGVHVGVVPEGTPDVPFAQETHEAFPMPDVNGARDVRAVAVDGEGAVWAATGAGVYARSVGEADWVPAIPGPEAGPSFDLAVDGAGRAWAAAWNGLYRATAAGMDRVAEVEGPIAAVCATREGVACVGPSGLWRITEAGFLREDLATARSFRALTEGPDGALWIATENGLYRLHGGHTRLYQRNGEILTAAVQDVAFATNGTLWAGGTGGITTFRDGEKERVYSVSDGLPGVYVQALATAPDGRMWIGTRQGVTRYNGTTWSLRHGRRWLINDDVRDIAFDPSGNAWIATAGGVSLIRRREMTLAEKADYFQRVCLERHVRAPWLVEHCRLRVPGDISTWEPDDDDNDGQYTAMYLAMESFRYAATRNPEARDNAKKAFDALRFLQTVTGTDGFVARTVIPATWTRMHDPNRTYTEREWAEVRVGDPREKRVENMWRPSKDGKWLWKGDTSSDEITGHMYGYLFYHDLVADAAERAEVAAHVRRIMDYIINGGYVLKDLDGTHTQWAVWSPEKLNGDPDWAAERGINSVEILSYLKLTYHMTGDPRYQREYERLIRDHHYAENARRAKTYDIMWRTHIDDELLALAFPALLLYETDPALKAIYRESLDHWYRGARRDQSPYFNFTYASLAGKEFHRDESMAFLRDAPLDLVNWRMDNTRREDIRRVRKPEIEYLQTSRILPVSERGVVRWDKNPWDAVAGDGGYTEWTPVYWLLPYWMGRYHGYIQMPQ